MREPFQLGSWLVEPGLLQVSSGRRTVRLEPRTMAVLCHLAARPGVTVSREELLDTVWKTRYVVEETLTRCISQLRQAFDDDPRTPKYIQTVPKLGYRLLTEPAAIASDAAGSSGAAPVAPSPGAEAPVAPSPDAQLPPRRLLEQVTWLVAALLLIGGIVVVVLSGHDAVTPARVAAEPARGAASQPAVLARSVAILPFVAIGDVASTEALADGITDDIIQMLGTVPGIRVPSRTSSFHFKKRDVDLATIARELDVAYVLEGSVRREKQRLRITAQLIDATSDAHIWSEVFERDLVAVFDVQREIALAVAQKLDVSIWAGHLKGGAATSDMAAYQLYLEARPRVERFEQRSVREGIAMLEEAVRRDPGFAAAWSSLAVARWIIPGVADLDPREVAVSDEAARRAARRALELDASRSGARFVLADSARVASRFAEAQTRYREALAMAPGNPALHIGYGNLLGDAGRARAALVQRELAHRLDPLSATAAFFFSRGHLFAGNYAEARRYLRRSRELGHQGPAVAYLEAYLGVRERNFVAARDALQKIPDTRERSAMLDVVAALANPMQRAQALESMSSLLPWYPLPCRGRMYAALLLGERELAWQAAVEGVEAKLEPTDTWWLPEAALLRSDPRFAGLAQRMKLATYWQEHGPPDACAEAAEDPYCSVSVAR